MEDPNSMRWELEHKLEQLLGELTQGSGVELKLDKSDVLYSRRCRQSVRRILHWMLINNYADDDVAYPNSVVSSNDHIGLLRKAFGYLAKYMRASSRELSLLHDHLFYPLDNMHISPQPMNLKGVTTISGSAFSSMQLCNSNGTMDSEARDVMSLLFPRGLGSHIPLMVNMHHSYCYPDTFRDKYVLVCCINVPAAPFGLGGMQSIFNLCRELSSLERDDVRVVMAARIHFLCDSPDIFKHVFQGLPSSCYVIPYEDWEQRERVYKRLGFGEEEFQCFVYNTDGLFLNSFCADGIQNPYGAEAFPFTKEMVDKVQRERVALRQGGSLEELLRPSYEDHPIQDVVVYEFNQTDGPKWPISQVVENKHVGLYVCCKGNLIPHLHKLYEQCEEKNEEFVIVVLYLPLLYNMDPKMFKEEMDGLFQEEQVRGWWCLPFNNSVSLRFWGLTKDYDIGECRFQQHEEDRLIIVGCDGKILDMYGAEVIKTHGIDGTYPFTRAAFVEKRMRELRSGEKLLELLSGAQLFRGNDPDDVISGKLLLNKKVIIYTAIALASEYDFQRPYYFQRVVTQYEEMKKDVDDEFEVVFVECPVPYAEGAVDARVFGEIPWYVHCPFDGTYTALSEELMKLVGNEALVGFGIDGRICSVKLLEMLGKTEGLCLEDTLFNDLCLFHQFDQHRDI